MTEIKTFQLATRILEEASVENTEISELSIDRLAICRRVLSILEAIDGGLINEIKWVSRIDEKIQKLRLDNDTDMDIDAALEEDFHIELTEPIDPPTFGNVIFYVEKKLQQIAAVFSAGTTLAHTCPQLRIALRLRSWIRQHAQPSGNLRLDGPLPQLSGTAKRNVVNSIRRAYGFRCRRKLFDIETKTFLISSWPAGLNSIINLAKWVENIQLTRRKLVKQRLLSNDQVC